MNADDIELMTKVMRLRAIQDQAESFFDVVSIIRIGIDIFPELTLGTYRPWTLVVYVNEHGRYFTHCDDEAAHALDLSHEDVMELVAALVATQGGPTGPVETWREGKSFRRMRFKDGQIISTVTLPCPDHLFEFFS